jgi:hypothetical protein
MKRSDIKQLWLQAGGESSIARAVPHCNGQRNEDIRGRQ